MKYDLDYQGAAEILESRVITSIPSITGRLLENSYLPEFNQDILEEAERLNAVLPLIKWEVDNNDLSEAMSSISTMRICSKAASTEYWTRRKPRLS